MRKRLAALPLIAVASSVCAFEPTDITEFDCQLDTPSGLPLVFRGSFQGKQIKANFADIPSALRGRSDGNARTVVSSSGEEGICITTGPRGCHSTWTALMSDGETIYVEMRDWYDQGVASVVLTARWQAGRHGGGAPLATGYCRTKRLTLSANSEDKK
jgi:hypothetical protein